MATRRPPLHPTQPGAAPAPNGATPAAAAAQAPGMPRANSYFVVDDHKPVFEPYGGSYEDATSLGVESPAAALQAEFPAAAVAASGANVGRRPGTSPPMPTLARRPNASDRLYDTEDDEESTDDESVADMARDLEAVADHCDIAIPVLFSELRRAVSSGSMRPGGTARRGTTGGASAGAVRPVVVAALSTAAGSGESSPLIQQATAGAAKASTESSPSHTPSARIRIGGAAGVVFDLDMLNEAEALSKSASERGALTGRSLRSQASSAARNGSVAPHQSSAARHSPERDLEAPLAADADAAVAANANRRAVRFRGPTPPATQDSNDSTPLSATGNINGSRRASEADLTALMQPNTSGRSDATTTRGDGSTSAAVAISSAKGDDEDEEDERPRVRWAEEIRRVYSYSVDNSVFITIEYARPLVGWLCLFIAVAMSSFDGVIAHYYLASGVTPYASFAWAAIGQAVVAAILMVAYTVIVGGLTRTEWRFLTSAMGWAQVAVVAFMFIMMSLAEQAASHMTRETRPFTGSAVHPLLIAGFGMVFKNTVFYEEIAGITVLLIGFGMAMMPADLHASRAYFAEVVYFSYGIFTASFLFACTRARARVPIPLLFASISAAYFIVQLPVCKLENMSASATDASKGVFGFAHRSNVLPFVFTTVFRSLSWILYLLALRFLPPVTVSAAMVIRPIISAFGVHMAFQVTDDDGADIAAATELGATYQHHTKFWRFLSLSHDATSAPSGPAVLGAGPFAPIQPITPPPPPTSSPALFTPLFAVGACIAVSATIYVIYISSIKRQKVELLLRLLSKRRRPRNPYSSRRPRADPVRTFPGSDSNSDRDSMDGEVYPTARGSGGRPSPTSLSESESEDRSTPLSPPSSSGFDRKSPAAQPALRSPSGRVGGTPTGSRTGSLTSGAVCVSAPVTMGRSPNRRTAVPVLSTSPKYMPTPPSNLTMPTQANSASDIAGNSTGTSRAGQGDYYDDDF